MPYFSGVILGLSGIFSGTNDNFLGQILQNSGTLFGHFSSAKSVNKKNSRDSSLLLLFIRYF